MIKQDCEGYNRITSERCTRAGRIRLQDSTGRTRHFCKAHSWRYIAEQRLQNEPYDSSHLPTCAVGTEQDFGGDCCCAEAREQMRGGRA